MLLSNYFKIILIIILISSNQASANSKERFLFEERGINSIIIKNDGDFPDPLKNINFIFSEVFKKNNSSVKILELETVSEYPLLNYRLKEYKNEFKTITFSDFFSFDVIEQQLKIAIEIKVIDDEGNIIWKRTVSRYKKQRWAEFSRPAVGFNPIRDYFLIPAQFFSSLKKQFSEQEIINNTLTEIVIDLADNLVRLNKV